MPPRNLELEARLAETDDSTLFELYADWLLERGDSRGELIRTQLALETEPHRPELKAWEKALLAEHGGSWLEGLEAFPMGRLRVTWRRGFVDSVTIEPQYESDHVAWMLGALAELPAAALVRSLDLGVDVSYSGDGAGSNLLEVLGSWAPPALRSLSFSPFDYQLSWSHLGELATANAALSRLDTLVVEAGRITPGRVRAPQLRSLEFVTGGLPAQALDDLAGQEWTCLERLVLFLGCERYGGTCTPSGVERVLATKAPALTSLALCNAEFADELVEPVARAGLTRQLRHLDLSRGTLGSEGAKVLLRHATAFAHLETLDLSNNYLSPDDCAALSTLGPAVSLEEQKVDDGTGRYTSVSE